MGQPRRRDRPHTPECRIASEKRNAERIKFEQQYPSFCRSCDGHGLIGNGQVDQQTGMVDADPCPECEGACPVCRSSEEGEPGVVCHDGIFAPEAFPDICLCFLEGKLAESGLDTDDFEFAEGIEAEHQEAKAGADTDNYDYAADDFNYDAARDRGYR